MFHYFRWIRVMFVAFRMVTFLEPKVMDDLFFTSKIVASCMPETTFFCKVISVIIASIPAPIHFPIMCYFCLSCSVLSIFGEYYNCLFVFFSFFSWGIGIAIICGRYVIIKLYLFFLLQTFRLLVVVFRTCMCILLRLLCIHR